MGSDINDQLATHVLQIFFISTDGTISIPLGFIPMKGMNGEQAFKIINPIIEAFKNATEPVDIVWGSSDGILTHHNLIDKIKKSGKRYFHIFDSLHIIKNLRNALLNTELTEVDKMFFNIHTLNDLRGSATPEIRNFYREFLKDCPIPKDQMDVAIIKQLLQPSIHEKLKTGNQSERALGKYLENVTIYHNIFSSTTYKEGDLEKLKKAGKYFEGILGLSSNLRDQIKISVESFESLLKYTKENNLAPSWER